MMGERAYPNTCLASMNDKVWILQCNANNVITHQSIKMKCAILQTSLSIYIYPVAFRLEYYVMYSSINCNFVVACMHATVQNHTFFIS